MLDFRALSFSSAGKDSGMVKDRSGGFVPFWKGFGQHGHGFTRLCGYDHRWGQQCRTHPGLAGSGYAVDAGEGQAKPALAIGLFSGVKLTVGKMRFPFDAHEPIEMHAFGLKPGFQNFAGFGAKFDEHLAFQHVDEDALGVGCAARVHALGEILGALAGEAGQGVLG
jgi:hypothetical protein